MLNRAALFVNKFSEKCILKYNIDQTTTSDAKTRAQTAFFFTYFAKLWQKVLFCRIFNGRKYPCVNITVHSRNISRYSSSPPPIAESHALGSTHSSRHPRGFFTTNVKKKKKRKYIFHFPSNSERNITQRSYIDNRLNISCINISHLSSLDFAIIIFQRIWCRDATKNIFSKIKLLDRDKEYNYSFLLC